MKAVLQYGQFTAMINLPERRYTIRIIKPYQAVSLIPLSEGDVIKPDPSFGYLNFRIEKQLSDDIWLYKFEGES